MGIMSTAGTYDAPGVHIEFGGATPVQGTGTLDGLWIYYRSRGEGWSLDVYDCEIGEDLPDEGHLVWDCYERSHEWPGAGYVAAEESCANIAKAVAMFREWRAAR